MTPYAASRAAALAGVAVAFVGGLVWVLAAGGDTDRPRGPIAVPNAEARASTEFLSGSVRHVLAPDAPERLIPDSP